jgi:lipoyl(octanoyl) transferase
VLSARSIVAASRQSDLLQVYLLGPVEYEEALRLQRLLAFRASEGEGGALVLCEHPPLITVGRHGSFTDILLSPEELQTRQWPVRWVPRGGGCVLHLPGQLAVYPVLPLARMSLGVAEYLSDLQRVLVAVLDDFGIRGRTRHDRAGVWVADRAIASVGVAVRDGVSLFGAYLNVDPDLTLAKLVRTDGGPMTSIARERKGPLRHAFARQRLLEHFAEAFNFARTELLFHPPTLADRPAVPSPLERPWP